MLNAENMETISTTSQYTIYSDTQDFILCFSPKDLVRRTSDQTAVINGLERVYELRKQHFIENLRCIAKLRQRGDLCGVLSDASHIFENQGILYVKSRCYNAEKLRISDPDDTFFCKLEALCKLIIRIIQETGHEPILQIDDVVFERNAPEQLHVLYIELLSNEKSDLNERLRNILSRKYYGRKPYFRERFQGKGIVWVPKQHPQFSVLLHQLLCSLLLHPNWTAALEIVRQITDLLKAKPDFLLYPYHAPYTPELPQTYKVQEAFHSGQHVIFLCGEDRMKLRKIADSYLSSAAKYCLQTAKGDAAAGISTMLESDAFAVQSGAVSASDRLMALKRISNDGVILLIEDCDVENDSWLSKLLRVPARILFLTQQNYEEYGFDTIIIQ